MPLTVADLIQAARIRHWTFAEMELGDGAALLFLNQRQRTHLGGFGEQIEGLIGRTVDYDLARHDDTGGLYALENGVPTFVTTFEDGYLGHLTDDGVPYIDTDDPPLARDPFGDTGGTPGFPLPTDMIRLINVAARQCTSNRNIPVDVIPERQRHARIPSRHPAAFVAGNRLVPVLPLASDNCGNPWMEVTAIQISYVALTVLSSLTDEVTLPSVLCEALTADLALLFARQSRDCDKADKAAFERDARDCAAAVAVASLDILESVHQSSVLFQR